MKLVCSEVDKQNVPQNIPKRKAKGADRQKKSGGKKAKKSEQKHTKSKPKQANTNEIERLTRRIQALENRTEKYISSFKTNVVESSRFAIEKAEETRNQNEQMILDLQRQMEDLRTAMIRLSGKIKSITGEKQ